jgi:hypothetical protein
MSIYVNSWRMKVNTNSGWPRWIEIYAQLVPAAIGQPSEDYETDPYSDFLPPITSDYDPEVEKQKTPYRAIVIVQEGFEKKDGQKYVDALLTMSYEDYEKITFNNFMIMVIDKIKKPGK